MNPEPTEFQLMSDRLKPIAEGLGPMFAELKRRAEATADLTARVRNTLPEPEKDHVISASYRDDTLIVSTDAAAWSTHIRYRQSEILDALRDAGETRFTKMRVKVGRKAVSG